MSTISNYISFIIKNTGALFVLKLSGIGLNYLVLMCIIYYYDFQGNGEYASFLAVSRAAKVFIVFGLDYLLVKQLTSNKDNDDKIIELFCAFIINSIILFIGFGLINLLIDLEIELILGVFLLGFWRIISHYFRGKDNMVLFGFFEFVIFQLTVLIALVVSNFVLHGLDLIKSIIYSNIVLALVAGFFTFKTLFSKYSLRKCVDILINTILSLKKIYNKSIHFVLTNSVNLISTAVLYTIIEYQFSEQILGVYDTILKYAQVISLPLIATNGRVLTLAAKYFNASKIDELKNYINRIGKMVILLSSAIFIVLGGFFYVYTEFFNKQLSAYWSLFLVLTLAQLISSYIGPVGVVLQVTNNEKIFNKLTIFTALYLTISTYLLSTGWSIFIVALNYMLYVSLHNITAMIILERNLNINSLKNAIKSILIK